MSKALNSPTGRLLRNSRLFSLPPPLPQPSMETITPQGTLRTSNTATHPYPTRQAISTPTASRSRGDWGLKRALPQRSTSSSTPHIRLKAIDNTYHITDFESAADHTQNLAKFQEMNIPITIRQGRGLSGGEYYGKVSVFEEDLDNTALDADQDTQSDDLAMDKVLQAAFTTRDKGDKIVRWKTKGPWVSGMQQDEFDKYLKIAVSGEANRARFAEYLKTVKLEQKQSDLRHQLRDEGVTEESEIEERMQAVATLAPDELESYIKELRDSHDNISSELAQHIQTFFDLPPLVRATSSATDSSRERSIRALTGAVHDTEHGSPPTHPSAGVSYLRTRSFMENHPLYGPQLNKTPVQSRVLRFRTMGLAQHDKAMLGMGGFTAEDGSSSRGFRQESAKDDPNQLTARVQLEREGGNKIWATVTGAHVDEMGRLRISAEYADSQAVAVRTGEFEPALLRALGVETEKVDGAEEGGAGTRIVGPEAGRARGLDDEARRLRGRVVEGKEKPQDVIRELLDRHQQR